MGSLSNLSTSDFKHFHKFHFFYFSRKDDQTFFLLTKKQSEMFAHISGDLDHHDPGILFTAGRKIMNISMGLLNRQNLEYFKEDSLYQTVSRDMLQFCKPRLQTPALMNSKVYQQFLEETFEAMLPYQTETNEAFFFVEVPFIDTSKFNNFCKENSIDFQTEYFAISDVILQKSEEISQETYLVFEPSIEDFVRKYLERSEPVAVTARYGVISIFTTPTNYRTMGILGSCFKKHGEEWKFYRFPIEEPTDEELAQFDGIFIPGASVSASDETLPWRENLLEIIRKAYNNNRCRILGTCFGIQIIAEAFQGKTGKMAEIERGTAKMSISREFWELPYVKKLNIEPKSQLLLAKSHADAVFQAPPMAKVFASSNCTDVEIMALGNRCLAFQGHPEMNEAWTACLLYQAHNEKKSWKTYYEEVKKKYFAEQLEHETWLKIMYNFFKSEAEVEAEV